MTINNLVGVCMFAVLVGNIGTYTTVCATWAIHTSPCVITSISALSRVINADFTTIITTTTATTTSTTHNYHGHRFNSCNDGNDQM